MVGWWEHMIIFLMAMYATFIGVAMMFLFAERRFSIKKTCIILIAFMFVLLLGNWLVFKNIGARNFLRLYPLTTHVTSMLVTAYISKNRGWRLMFQFLSCVLFCCLIQHISMVICLLGGQKTWVFNLSYCVTVVLVFYLFFKYLRPLYFDILHKLESGWALICLPLIIYYIAVFALIEDPLGQTLRTTVTKLSFTLLATVTYVLIVLIFYNARREMEIQYSSELLALQISALQDHIKVVHDTEKKIRIERHDLRHRLNTIAALINEDNKENALKYIAEVQGSICKSKREQWCSNPILNAMFSIYFSRAHQDEILIEAKLDFPKQLPVDVIGLSVVFANGLDNAIHACQKLPQEKRKIICKAISYPQLMIEIANPCGEPVLLNRKGVPSTAEEGHGIGLQSIKNFCEKNNATCSCSYKNEWFYLRISF